MLKIVLLNHECAVCLRYLKCSVDILLIQTSSK